VFAVFGCIYFRVFNVLSKVIVAFTVAYCNCLWWCSSCHCCIYCSCFAVVPAFVARLVDASVVNLVDSVVDMVAVVVVPVAVVVVPDAVVVIALALILLMLLLSL